MESSFLIRRFSLILSRRMARFVRAFLRCAFRNRVRLFLFRPADIKSRGRTPVQVHVRYWGPSVAEHSPIPYSARRYSVPDQLAVDLE